MQVKKRVILFSMNVQTIKALKWVDVVVQVLSVVFGFMFVKIGELDTWDISRLFAILFSLGSVQIVSCLLNGLLLEKRIPERRTYEKAILVVFIIAAVLAFCGWIVLFAYIIAIGFLLLLPIVSLSLAGFYVVISFLELMDINDEIKKVKVQKSIYSNNEN